MEYQLIIGLEIHIELNTQSKMFCNCRNDPNEEHANINICPICLGHPGTLPVINKEAIKKVMKTGLALNCQIPRYSKFDRKNYFYPDLPKGYQISQYDAPLCKEGYLEIPGYEVKNQNAKAKSASQQLKVKRIRIRRVHLEEDTGRLLHPEGRDYSLVDFNRAGIPLMELVTEPDINSAKEARKFAEELQLILRYLEVSKADMEKGEMRVEVNLSLSKKEGEFGTKVEIKNLNSFRSVERAIEYEIKRQSEILDRGEKVVQETRGWLDEATTSSRRVAGAREDDIKGVTVSQREKEEAHDYRYFPEPDLPPLHFKEKDILEIQKEIPELPEQRRQRFSQEYKLDEGSLELFIQNKQLGEYFEKVVSEFEPRLKREKLSELIKLAANYLISDLQGLLKGKSVKSEKFLITPENFAEFITLIFEGKISSKIAKMVLEEMFKKGSDPSLIIEERGLTQITDGVELEKIIREVLSTNQKAIEDYKKGKENAFQFLVGQVMAKTRGKANPQIIQKILTNLLKKS